jgi:hypothetical protein
LFIFKPWIPKIQSRSLNQQKFITVKFNICLNTLLIRTFIQAFRFTRPRTKNPRKKNAKERKRKKGQERKNPNYKGGREQRNEIKTFERYLEYKFGRSEMIDKNSTCMMFAQVQMEQKEASEEEQLLG